MLPLHLHLRPSAQARLPDVCRHLPQGLIAGYSQVIPLRDGDLALAEVLPERFSATLDLVSGRAATLFPGDRFVCVVGRFAAPLAVSCEKPAALGEAALVHRCGVAGLPTQRGRHAAEPIPIRLLGVAVDATGAGIGLERLALPMPRGQRPLNTLAVVSAARGARSSLVASAAVRGFCRMGLSTATAKPIGVLDAAERWAFLDAGAIQALDLVDAGYLSSVGLSGSDLCARAQGMLGQLTSSGAEAAVLRIAGGIGVTEVAGLIRTAEFADAVDGVVLAAADALSAIEGARRLLEAGLPLIAVSGAITRSPLACREAAAGLPVPVLAMSDLAQPAVLQRLMTQGLHCVPALPLAMHRAA